MLYLFLNNRYYLIRMYYLNIEFNIILIEYKTIHKLFILPTNIFLS